MISRRLEIARKTWYTQDIFGFEFYYPGIHPVPGQFFQIQVDEGIDPFLNRPISVASYKATRLRLIIKVVGRGTRMLGGKSKGEPITLFGPFGKRFRPQKKKSLLIAGGIGIAPLHFLAEHLYSNRIPFDLLYGVRTTKDFILRKEMSRMCRKSLFVAEHGLKRKETAVSAIRRLKIDDYEVIYSCGPKQMLVEMQRLNLPVPVYAFCEDFLGCGCGLCLGCAIMYKNEYRRICVDGPIFELREIDFEV
jgi:dihydroorotate dehydrogenase electron transfer subunit